MISIKNNNFYRNQINSKLKSMKVSADENIPRVKEVFSQLGEVHTMPGRTITASDLTDTDILLVRSVTPVNASLLANTPVKFVGSATIGEDHIDTHWLQQQGIAYANAPGSNAQSVAEYVITVIFNYCLAFNKDLHDLTVGIIGEGNVGTRLRQILEQLQVKVLVNDPLKALCQGKDTKAYVDFKQILQADILTFHTPLTVKNAYPTWHKADDGFLTELTKNKAEKLIINTARGAVVDNAALLQQLSSHSHLQAVLDVWENEPAINTHLLEKCFLATPHVAGYSEDGKLAGTDMIYKAACTYFNIPLNSEQDGSQLIKQIKPSISLKLNQQSKQTAFLAVASLLNEVFPIKEDDKLLRQIIYKNEQQQGEYFDYLRKNYRLRKEFSNYSVEAERLDSVAATLLANLGFHLKGSPSRPRP